MDFTWILFDMSTEKCKIGKEGQKWIFDFQNALRNKNVE